MGEPFSATRVKPLADGPRFTMENTRVGLRFVGDRVASPTRRDVAQLEPGEGMIVSSRGEKVAGCRDDGARCTLSGTRHDCLRHIGEEVARGGGVDKAQPSPPRYGTQHPRRRAAGTAPALERPPWV